MLGLAPMPEDQTPKPPFQPSGNPVWDEIQQAHGQLSPAAQRAVAMSGVPRHALASESAAPTPMQPQQTAALPASMRAQGLASEPREPHPMVWNLGSKVNRAAGGPDSDSVFNEAEFTSPDESGVSPQDRMQRATEAENAFY